MPGGRIADCWIVNLVNRVVEVYREPARPRTPRLGYVSIATLYAGPLFVAGQQVEQQRRQPALVHDPET